MIMRAYIYLGWSPILAVVADGARRVLQVTGWTGGNGTAPATGLYIGATGFVSDIADGVDISGGVSAVSWGDILGTLSDQTDLQSVLDDKYNSSNPAGYITASGAPVQSVSGKTGVVTLVKGDVGLGNVDNTSDANKPVSTAQQTALDLKYDASNPSGYISNITGISAGGELSGTYPNPAILNSAVLAKLLTGLNVSGSSIASTDSIIEAFGKLQSQINGVLGGAIYQGVWNANTNTPTLADGVGTKGYYYVVSVDGSINLGGGVIDFKVGDWAIYNGAIWQKVDNTDAVSSVNGQIGAVNLTTANISEVTNLYFTTARVLATALTGYTSGAGVISASDTVLQAIQKLNGNIAALTTANIPDSTNRRYVTDAQQVVIGNTSGTNTGDNATNSQYSGLAASKQDTLVSGTNIKTINGNTILGSGDLPVGGGDVSGPSSATDTAIARFDSTTGKLLKDSSVKITDNGSIVLPENSNPTASGAGEMKLFSRQIANRLMPAFIGPSGLDSTLQPLLARNKVGYWNPPGNATTVPGVLGFTAPTITGFTATARNIATTNFFTRMRRLGYVTATTAGTVGNWRIAVYQFTVGSSVTGLGGFTYIIRFGISDAATVAGARMFKGLRASATPANVEPSTLTNCIGIGHGAADTNFKLFYGGSSAQTPIDLGVNFPSNTLSTDVYELALFSSPNSGDVHYEVTRLNTGHVATGTIVNSGSAVLPTNTTLLAPWGYRTNNATALAVGLDVMSAYIETDY